MKFRKHLLNVKRLKPPYSPVDKVRLHASERDMLFSSKLWSQFKNSLNPFDINYYPDTQKVYDKLSKFLNVDNSDIIIGDGSDRIIKYVFECFAVEDSNIVTTDPCFPMYNVYSQLYNVYFKAAKYNGPKFDYKDLIKLINDDTSIVIFSNPISPIGDILTKTEIDEIVSKAREHGAIVVIDEAYVEFSEQKSLLGKLSYSENVIFIKTFSKAIGSAGIRFGYGISNPPIIEIMKKFLPMNEITSLTGKWVSVLIDNWHEVETYINNVIKNRNLASQYFVDKGYEVYNSQSNWIHLDKLDFDEQFVTKQCKLPWSDKTFTRLCIPGDKYNFKRLL